MNWTARRRWVSPAFLLGLSAVAAARLLTLPQSLREWDEILFARGVEDFDPVHHQPHPPGYPLLIGLGKLFNLVLRDSFTSLVVLSVVASLVGFAALVVAFRRFALATGVAGSEGERAAERIAVGGAALLYLGPPLLVYGPLALSDSPALMFLALALAAAAALPVADGSRTALAFGAFASAAIGCRPQLALSVLPMVAVALLLSGREGSWRPGWRKAGLALAAFTLVSLLWFVPLVAAVGGPEGFVSFLGKQAQLFATYDAKVPRAQLSPAFIAYRFIAHPWGQRWTSIPLLLLAAAGLVALAVSAARAAPAEHRWRRVLPLLVLCGIEFVLCLAVMSPADGVRYALPYLIGVAFLAGIGAQALARLAGVPAAAWLPSAALAAGFVLYTAPFLRDRATTFSPPAQAARWVAAQLPPSAVLLVEKELAAHAAYLMSDFRRATVAEGMEQLARSPETPVYLFGDGPSAWPGAQTFAWPESDAYGKLTRNLYRVVTISPIPAERRFRTVRGVHAPEPSLRDPRWRWLDPDASIRVFPVQGAAPGLVPPGAVRLRLGLPAHAPIAAVRVRIAAPGIETALEIPRGGEREAVLPLPGGTPVFEIGLRSEPSFVPAKTLGVIGKGGGNGGPSADTRRVAVQLLSVEQLSK
jgi:hypothetical protein